MTAPERIWADTEGGWMPHDCSEIRRDPCVEYIRADLSAVQPAALDRLIAEAVKPYVDAMRYYETQFCEGFCEDMPDRSVTNEGMENDCSGCKARAILALIGEKK